jgi:hypothetical protein
MLCNISTISRISEHLYTVKTMKNTSILSLVTTDVFWIDNRIYWTVLQLVITLHRSPPHRSVSSVSLLGNLITTCNIPSDRRMAWPLSSVCIAHVACYWKFFLVNYVQVLYQSMLLASHLSYLCYNGSLVTSTVVASTAAKFKPLLFSMSSFSFSYAANMFILIIWYNDSWRSRGPDSKEISTFNSSSLNHWVMHPVARVSTNICRSLRMQQMSVLVLLCTSYFPCCVLMLLNWGSGIVSCCIVVT